MKHVSEKLIRESARFKLRDFPRFTKIHFKIFAKYTNESLRVFYFILFSFLFCVSLF